MTGTCSICGTPLKKRQRSECSVTCQRKAQATRNSTYSDEQREQVRNLRAQGWSAIMIARKMGFGHVATTALIRRLKCDKPERWMYAKSGGDPSREQDEIVRQMYPVGASFDAIKARVDEAGEYKLRTQDQLKNWAKRLKVTRPDWWLKQLARERSVACWETRRANMAKRAGVVALHVGGRQPRTVSLAVLCRIGRELGLSPEAALDVARVSAAQRKAEPGHAGYVLETYRGAWERAA